MASYFENVRGLPVVKRAERNADAQDDHRRREPIRISASPRAWLLRGYGRAVGDADI